jgi:hypothetical protein
MPVGGGEEQRVTDALHKFYWGHFAVTDAGIYLLDSDTAPKPTIMFYSFQTRLAYTGAPATLPIGVSSYSVTPDVPNRLQGQLPSADQIASLLAGID